MNVDRTPGASDWTLGMALRSVPFWAVFSMWGFGVIGYQIVTTHQVAHALDRGFSALTLGWVFGLGGACTVAGNVIGGPLSDRWGRERVFALGSAIGIAGIGLPQSRGEKDPRRVDPAGPRSTPRWRVSGPTTPTGAAEPKGERRCESW